MDAARRADQAPLRSGRALRRRLPLRWPCSRDGRPAFLRNAASACC